MVKTDHGQTTYEHIVNFIDNILDLQDSQVFIVTSKPRIKCLKWEDMLITSVTDIVMSKLSLQNSYTYKQFPSFLGIFLDVGQCSRIFQELRFP